MSDPTAPRLRVTELASGRATPVALKPDAETRAAIAAELGLLELPALALDGKLAPEGRRDWRFEGKLTARVVQPCGVTLKPVTTAIAEPVTRLWSAEWHEPEGDEVEILADVDVDPLEPVIDLGALMAEALSLALPAFPRAEGVELEGANFTEPGKAAMTDEDARPFAGLAALRDKLAGDDSEG